MQNDPNLQDIAQDFTLDMFSVEGIALWRVLKYWGPHKHLSQSDTYMKSYVPQNCLKIIRDVEKHDLLTDGFVHNQVINFVLTPVLNS